jgi:DNA invertase Pin-like site-specific DNA recombinase
MVAYLYLRFSTKKQKHGNSTARQVERAKAWCEKRKIRLDETLSYFDEGVSAHRGKHRIKGGLGLFLAACETKRVKRGSYLLVESIDRLSRENLFEGQALVKRVLYDYGITIVVLSNDMEFTAANYRQTHWYMDAEFDRAHAESERKSDLSRDNWEQRRRNIEAAPLTRKIPSWLNVDGGKVVRDKRKCAVVSRIFNLTVNGFGAQALAKRLNAEGVKPISKARFWHASYIEKLTRSRAVLGEFQPRMLRDGKLVPVGDVRKGYYPQVITPGSK